MSTTSGSVDLARERAAASFDVRKLTYILDGGEAVTRRKEAMAAIVESEPVFDNRARFSNNYEQAYVAALAKMKRMRELQKELNLDGTDMTYLQGHVNDSLPGFLHDVAFVPTLKGQADEEQKARWLEPALNYAIIGCYAQTELGHGSNVRALETTATYIPETDEIELHSPTLTSTKWWPGALGRTATHAVVYASLLLPRADGTTKDMGIHAFMLQIRSLEDHTDMPGLMIGTIGPKFGANGIDNGWMRMNRVRIPRRNMLMRFATLSSTGKYEKQGHSKAAYGTMVFIRATLVVGSASAIARAATIATRYGVVRKQFSMRPHVPEGGIGSGADPDSGVETSILDYPLFQRRIVPLLSQAYALYFTGKFMIDLYTSFQANLNTSNDFSLLPELHAASAGLKSYCTSMAAAGVETCRRACGGHGYSMFSGLGDYFNMYVGVCTAEGDNYLMTLQTSRYLIKSLQRAQSGKPLPKTAQYLADIPKLGNGLKCGVASKAAWLNGEAQAAALNAHAAAVVARAATKIASLVGDGAAIGDAFTTAQPLLWHASNAHCVTIMTTGFNDGIAKAAATDAAIAAVLRDVCSLFCLTQLEQAAGDLLEVGYLTSEQVGWIRESVDDLVLQVRRQSVPLTDAFNMSDKFLNSALGRADGRVYETLWEWARGDPMNQGQVYSKGYENYIKPMLDMNKHLRSRL